MATPQRFSGRVSTLANGRVRRALNAHGDSLQRYGDSLEVDKTGRLETRLARNSGLQMTRQGLKLDPIAAGEKNNPPMKAIRDPASASAADVHTTMLELLSELRRTKRIR